MQIEKSSTSSSMDEEIQKVANKIKGDVEKMLGRVFKNFHVVESDALLNEKMPGSTSYSMKVKTGDSDESYLKLRTTRKDHSSHWMTAVDELFLPSSPFENMLTLFDQKRTGFSSIQKLADNVKKDVEKMMNRSFKMFDVIDYHPILTDPKQTSYYMRIKTDDNGHVRVKTIKKTPDSNWETHVEEYERGKATLGGQKGMQSVEGMKGEPMMEEKGTMKGSERMQEEGGSGTMGQGGTVSGTTVGMSSMESMGKQGTSGRMQEERSGGTMEGRSMGMKGKSKMEMESESQTR